ncbi:MAG: flagellar export chaperone FlgN [Peptostreptococcaceae bacterium]|nr:flagellar export chaperone FlgN [Peptostreptococcaceae bacterium]
MRHLLQRQENLLRRLADLLREEKDVLIHEDGKRLMKLVALKESIQKDLDQTENFRKEAWGNISLGEMVRQLDEKRGRSLFEKGEAIKNLADEVKALQEINIMLTQQSVKYAQRLMDILQKAIRKSGITYGQKGTVANKQGVTASMDRSV